MQSSLLDILCQAAIEKRADPAYVTLGCSPALDRPFLVLYLRTALSAQAKVFQMSGDGYPVVTKGPF